MVVGVMAPVREDRGGGGVFRVTAFRVRVGGLGAAFVGRAI